MTIAIAPPAARRTTLRLRRPVARLWPGVLLAAIVGVLAVAAQGVETRWLGHPLFEALVLAIVIGTIVRTVLPLPARVEPGVQFAAKEVLELAIVLLGAAVDLPALLRAGPLMLVGVAATVAGGIVFGTVIGRALGLDPTHALLVACGNAICGNSAIAAIAPVVGARKEHVASAIAFTAVLGVVVILGLPLLIHPFHLTHYQYGVLAGMTVYAVPQVLAAAFPVSALSGEVGTLTKLVRVLLLGPVVLILALVVRRRVPDPRAQDAVLGTVPHPAGRMRQPRALLHRLTSFVPWFIIGFVVVAALRSAGALGDSASAVLRALSTALTVAAMAALGLGVDLRALARVGPRVVAAVTGSLAIIVAMSLAVVHWWVHA